MIDENSGKMPQSCISEMARVQMKVTWKKCVLSIALA